MVGLGFFFVYGRQRVTEAERPRIAFEVKGGERRPKKILVPVAAPEHVETAMSLAVALARTDDAEVIALNAVRIPPQLPLSEGRWYAGEAEPVIDEGARFAERHPDVTINSIVGVGHQVSKVILNVAEREEVETIVLGWRGMVHESRLRGSVAQAVVNRAPTDLVLVKDRGFPDPPGEVVVGVSPGIRSRVVLETAVRLARGLSSDLRLVTILTSGTEQERNGLSGWLEEVRRRIIRAGLPPDRLKADVVEGDSESAVDLLISQPRVNDLLVVGASRNWIFRRYLLGSIPDQIANRSGCTTVMVKEREPRGCPSRRGNW